MLNRLASRLPPPLARCASPDLPFSPSIRPYRSITQAGKHYSKSQFASPEPLAQRNKGVTGACLFSSTSQTRQSANFSSEMGFENLLVGASRHRAKCYVNCTGRNDDSSEYSDYEERP